MVTIKDISQKANVSISTVSYALNGSSQVSDKTREKILKIAKELNYVPNAAARSLKTKKTQIIGVFLSNFSGSFYNRLVHGMKEVLIPAGYAVILCSGKQSHRLLSESIIDGGVILDHNFTDQDIQMYTARNQPVVVLDRELHNSSTSQITLDNEGGASLALNYCYEKGFRYFYIVKGPNGTYDSDMRLRACQAFLESHKDVTADFIEGDFKKPSGYKAASYIVSKGLKNSVVFSFNDEMAIGMYDYFKQTTYLIGKDIHIIGFDNIELASYLTPRLTTISYSLEDWGRCVAQSLLSLIENNGSNKQIIYTSLIEGGSVGQEMGYKGN